MKIRFYLRLVLAFNFLVVGCTTPQVISFYNEKVDFGRYKSYEIINPTRSKEDFSDEALKTIELIETAIATEMERKKYSYGYDSDLIIYYRYLVGQKVDYVAEPAYSRYHYDPYDPYYQPRQKVYDEGTFSIELKDSRTKKLVWQGSLDLKIKPRSKLSREEIVNQTITSIFAKYPFEAGNPTPLFDLEEE